MADNIRMDSHKLIYHPETVGRWLKGENIYPIDIAEAVVFLASSKSTKTTAARIENSSMVNINPQNNLKLSVGETFRLRSFRAGWQIINTDTANIMIEPDFHYNIISGAEHITMTPVSDLCTGNAGSGENSNWMDIKAVSAGTVIMEVSYDAIQVDGDTTYPGLFGACGEDGKSVVVINIGTNNSNTLQITPVHGTHTKEDHSLKSSHHNDYRT